MVEGIIIGVLSGVLSAVFVFLVGLFIKVVVIPWYQTIIYSGVNISGEWHIIDPSLAQEITLNLTQKANQISGAAFFIWDHEEDNTLRGYEVVRNFKVEGRIQDRFVQLILTHTDSMRLGINTYLLEVCGDGRKMVGSFSFYSVDRSKIENSYSTLCRDRAFVEATDGLKKKKKLQLMKTLNNVKGASQFEDNVIYNDCETRPPHDLVPHKIKQE